MRRKSTLLLLMALLACTAGSPPLPPPPPPSPAPPPPPLVRWAGGLTICFPEYEASDVDMMAIVREAAATWMANAGVEIGVSETCAVASGGSIIAATFLRDPGAFASSDALGNRMEGGGMLQFKVEYDWRDPICGDRGTIGARRCAYADALHEIGHLLGFSHDHISANAPICEGRIVSRERADREIIYYDPDSIMNYCNPKRWEGRLSPADICSMQVAYPLPGQPQREEAECEALTRKAESSTS